MAKFCDVGMLPCFDPTYCPEFRTDFQLEKEGIWTSVLYGNCRCNCELDVRLLNHPNWTSITQVMVYFPRLPQIATICSILTLYIVQILGLIFDWEKEEIWSSVLHGNCIFNCELDVRFLNHQNWTSITQVIVHFPGLPQVALF